ncbi:MAG: NDP-sugar synthase [Victivallales bacterium]|nr:NDP-sugar synthase [Victivallales bacterium]
MKCLIICPSESPEWSRDYFYDLCPYMIRIANKPLLEFLLDLVTLLDLKDIVIIQRKLDGFLADYFRTGARWNVNISYESNGDTTDIAAIIRREAAKNQGDLLFINGIFFPDYDHAVPYELPTEPGYYRTADASGRGFYLIRRGTGTPESEEPPVWREFHAPRPEIRALDNIRDIYRLNMDMVEGMAERYLMPGYSNEKGVSLGQNVELMKSAAIIPPVIMGNNIQLRGHVRIGPNAVVGDNTLIDTGSTIANAVIFGNTYIGSDLEINAKIIFHRQLIEPDSGQALDIVDDFLVSEIPHHRGGEIFVRVLQWPIAALLLLGQLPFFLLLRPLIDAPSGYIIYRPKKSAPATRMLPFYLPRQGQHLFKLFWKLSLDKFALLWLVLRGKLYLVGNLPLPDSTWSNELLEDLRTYHPAAFSFSEMRGHCLGEQQIDEIYYSRHRSLWFDAVIMIRSLVLRLISPVKPIYRNFGD